MPGLGKSGTSRIRDFKWSIDESSLNSKRGVGARWLETYFFYLVHYRPLRSGGQIMFESFNAAGRSFRECLNRSVRTVAHVTHHLMSRGCSLRKEPVSNSLDFATYQKLSRYSHTTYT